MTGRPARTGGPTKPYTLRLDEHEAAVFLRRGPSVSAGVRAAVAELEALDNPAVPTPTAEHVRRPSDHAAPAEYQVVVNGQVVYRTTREDLARTRAKSQGGTVVPAGTGAAQ